MDNIKAFLEADALRTQGEWHNHCGNVWFADVQMGSYGEPEQFQNLLANTNEIDGNFIAAASRIAPDLAKMVEDLREAREALEGLHDDNMDYLTKNHLGGGNNHWMVCARKALTRLKPYEKLFEKEGER